MTAVAAPAVAAPAVAAPAVVAPAVKPAFNQACGQVVHPSTRAGGTLRLVSSAGVDSLDPARTYYVWCWLLQRMLQRTVMAFAPEPGEAGRRVVPDLATGPGESGDGGRTWTYRLRHGVRFDDGSPVTAHDVKYAVERIFAQNVLPGGPTYLLGLLDGGDRYPGPYGGAELPAVQAPDDHTLVFHLCRPFADFDYLMAQPNTAPVPRHRDTGARYGDAPAYTGPYAVAEHVPGRLLRLRRNRHWRSRLDPVRPALPDEVTVTMGLRVDEVDARLIAGEFDINVEGRGVQPAAQARLLADPALLSNVDNPATGFVHYIAVQPQVPPLDNVHCRRAVHYAADRIALQEARGGPVVGGDLATGVLPSNLVGHRSPERYPPGPDRRGDLDAARAELAAAGLPDGFDTVIATQRGKFRAVADALAASIGRVGIRARVLELDVATYYRDGLGLPATVRRLGLGLGVTDWGADFPTPYGFLAPLVDGRTIKPHGGNHNFAELDDPRINALLDEAMGGAAMGGAARPGLWREIEELVMGHAVMLPVTYDKTVHYRNPSVTNVYVHPAFGLYDVQAMGVDVQARGVAR
jgi:peptide/nickel transport system substrate-binding protein